MNEMKKEVVEALQHLERRGVLKPEVVIEAARDKKSPLHDCFDWDDRIAAARWRIVQARELIRRVKIEVTVEEKEVRVCRYVSVGTQEEAKYKVYNKPPIAKVLADELARIRGNVERTIEICEARPCDETDTLLPILQDFLAQIS